MGGFLSSATFENAIFSQPCTVGELSYLSRGSEQEIDFVLAASPGPDFTALEVKVYPLLSDLAKTRQLAERRRLAPPILVGRYPTPGFSDFIWGGQIL